MTSMVHLAPHFLDSFFNQIAAGFNWAGLTGSQGETGGTTAGWGFDSNQNLAYRYGQAHAFVVDMHRAFYASRAQTYTRYAFMPQDTGSEGSGSYNAATQILEQTVGLLIPQRFSDGVVRGSTGDRLTAFGWTGATGTTQDNVLHMSLYSSDGLNKFKTFCDGMWSGFDYERGNRPAITTPSLLAYDNEVGYRTSSPIWWLDNGVAGAEIGAFFQNLNDARVNTYGFFDGRYTLKQIWGATGSTSEAFRGANQHSFAITITGPDNRGSLTITSDAYVDVIFSQRVNSINYAPNYMMFINSFLQRHKQHLIATSWQTWHNELMLIGNYEMVASTREYPILSGKFPQWIYTCDVSCTGNATGHASSVTGTFPLDYSCPVLYLQINADPQQWLPASGTVASSPLYKNYSGAYGTSSLNRIGTDSGLYSQGAALADYVGFLQRCGSVGMTAMQGGGTAQGYTGANITDFIDYSLNHAKHLVNNTRSSLNKFTDNASKPIIPWIGNVSETYTQTQIFSLTGTQTSTLYADLNGLTSFAIPAFKNTHISIPTYGTMINLQYNVDLIKWCIKTHNITDFLVFESGFDRTNASSSGVQAADFWLSVIESLIADSASESASSSNISSPSSSNYFYFSGKLYTRQQYEQILRAFYPDVFI